MAKKRKKILPGKYLIIISSIIVLNAIGVSYSYWTDQLQINTTMTTGSINPNFCQDYWINIVRDGSEKGNYPNWDDDKNGNNLQNDQSKLSNLDITFDEKRQTMLIKGDLEEGYSAFIHYCVVNNGTVPIKYMQQNRSEKSLHEELKMQDGLKVQVNQPSNVIDPQEKLSTEHSNGNPKIQIQLPDQADGHSLSKKVEEHQADEDEYTFEVDLPFEQWTGNKSSYWGSEDEN